MSPSPAVSVIPVVSSIELRREKLLMSLAVKGLIIQAGKCLCHAGQALPI